MWVNISNRLVVNGRLTFGDVGNAVLFCLYESLSMRSPDSLGRLEIGGRTQGTLETAGNDSE
jgi:hypothetical protein